MSLHPYAAPQASAPEAIAYAASEAAQAAISGARLRRHRPASSPAKRKARSAAPNARSASIPQSYGAGNLRFAMGGAPRLLTPGPTPLPPEVVAALASPLVHHRTKDFRLMFGRVLDRLAEVHRTRHEVLVFTASGTGSMEGAVANTLLARRPGARRLVRELRRALGRDRRGVRLRGRPPALRLGRDAAGLRHRVGARRGRRDRGVHHAERDLDRRRRGHRGDLPRGRRRCAARGRCHLEPRRRPARDRRLGGGRRRRRLAEGLDDPTGPCHRGRVPGGAGPLRSARSRRASTWTGRGRRRRSRRIPRSRRSRRRSRS